MIAQDAVATDVPERALDPLAHITLQRWSHAVEWRDLSTYGSKSVSRILRECYEQRYGILPDEDKDIVELLRTEFAVNFSALKVTTLTAWMRENLVNASELPFGVQATPIPALSDDAKLVVLQKVKEELFLNGWRGNIRELVGRLKDSQLQQEREYSELAASRMQKLIYDQCIEGGFQSALLKTIEDIATYPFSVLYGPIPERVTMHQWVGSKITPKDVIAFKFYPVSVWDFFWMPDCSNSQDGAGVFIRQQMSKAQLLRCAEMDSYIKGNVFKVLDDVHSGVQSLRWTSEKPENKTHIPNMWDDDKTIEVLHHYGVFSGSELHEYGITGVEDQEFYECHVTVVGKYTIQAHINPVPSVKLRPVYTASFDTDRSTIMGTGICQKIRDAERAYHMALRFMMNNASFSAGPVGELDISRISKYADAEFTGQLQPMSLYPTDAAVYGGSTHALNLYNIPSNVGSFMAMASYFSDLMDRITQLPAAMHGEPVGTGANRTFRGITFLTSQAMRVAQSAVGNMDETIFKPLGTLMYNYNMEYSDDDSIRGDAQVVPIGASGIVAKEIERQQAMDILQLVVQVGTVGAGLLSPELISWAIKNLLSKSGIPPEVLSATSTSNQVPTASDVQSGEPSISGGGNQSIQAPSGVVEPSMGN